jgi:hypothetical protein
VLTGTEQNRRIAMLNQQFAVRAASVVLVAGALAGTGARLQAGEESNILAQARAIEGVWEPVVTIRDCQSGVPLVSFPSMDSYNRGGSLVVEGGGEFVSTTGLGSWRHVGGRNFTALYQFFSYGPDGRLSGKLKVSARIRLSADGGSFRTTDTAELLDLNGTVIGQVCGTREARRLE